MYTRVCFLSFIFVLSVATTCMGGPIITPAESFYKKNPEVKDNYKLYPTSIRSLKIQSQEMHHNTMFMIQAIKGNFSNVPNLAEYLEQWEKTEKAIYKEKIENLNDIQAKINENSYLYYFEYEDDKIEESGMLILHKDEIKWRIVQVSGGKGVGPR